MIPEFTVTEITSVLKNLLHEVFYSIRVRGEISGVSHPTSGHVYFTLKDDNSVLNAVCWNHTKVKAPFRNGVEVTCSGHLSIYQSKYQLILTDMELVGDGKLAAMLAELKKKLETEGLFDIKRKKRLPLLPMKIGVITSSTGTVLQDIINRVTDRFPSHLILWAVHVQGTQASSMVANAIRGFHALEDSPDVIIVARGGGSVEDLWPFNDEALARVVASSEIPIVSAIGHETDFTIIDYVADLRAPTPTAAVELILPEKHKLLESLEINFLRMAAAFRKVIQAYQYRLLKFQNSLIECGRKVLKYEKAAEELRHRMFAALQTTIFGYKQNLESLKHRLDHYDKQHILNVGYAVIYNSSGLQVVSTATVLPDDVVTIELKDGKVRALILP
ncbi:exodeoxyribonuclease VII large subunit [Anaplasma bovis]|uniref:exodeoxyribonuclease VII large subunit n=1 Tax=Anaplasma bovis TaxID=186733 RepID=UPI002FF1FA59